MLRGLLFLGLLGCTDAVGSTDSDTDSDTDPGVPESCEVPELEGSWSGEHSNDVVTYTLDATYVAAAEVGETLGTLRGLITNRDPNVECVWDSKCTNRPQNDWHLMLRVHRDDACGGQSGYDFVRVNQDGTLTLEQSDAEFGDRTGDSVTLHRVD